MWRKHLQPHEFCMLSFILDATINWGFASRLFTSRFVGHGDNAHCGTGMTDRTIRRNIAALEEKGVIIVDRSDMTKGLRITPNVYWNPEELMLSVPKRLKNAEESVTYKSDNGLTDNDFTGMTPDTHVASPRTSVSSPPGHPRPDIKDDFLQADFSKSKEHLAPGKPEAGRIFSENDLFPETTPERAEPSSRKKETSSPIARAPSSDGWNDPKPVKVEPHRSLLKPGAIEKTFRRAFETENENISGAMHIAWTSKEQLKVKSAILNKWKRPAEECHDFFEWLVRDWFEIRIALFEWLEKNGKEGAPARPHVAFIIRWNAALIDYWDRRAQKARIKGLDSREEQRLALLSLEGKTREEALLIIAEERATEKMRDENAKSVAAARQAHGAARILEKQLVERQRWGVHNPHPSSQIAQQMRQVPVPVSDEALPTIEELINTPFREE
ncbi:hypothetical protein FHS21_004165 [Phyllobacterium trifolii]|uniref:Uncharacterized protein n=1 Tax=Phyllobacterium trifolii TaxID=300193 RepID=A0A839UD29_9HYPH|nr:hypothetical protein [Phyllobacterium trifolii]MBB3147733.1 hypothetical protein [Phyllobacterium trifolii]